ncbi:LRRN4 C-terminal-like protein [Kryptolebias marmoratus]|uniref:LRRN4 C-terminal like n=1 Tax=Kryptolebias marmoratus TaxID=37003 RepID=A0A3Q3A8X1_KRYMA|nr:LRRN4 C-terminal-like protein [Kryptolebias marmoratus]
MKTTVSSMANPMRNLLFSFLIVCLVSIRGYCQLPILSAVRGTHPDVSDDDYYEDTVTPKAPDNVSQGAIQRCDYDRCRDNQTLCSVLSEATGCFCPGFTLYNEKPKPPEITEVSQDGSGVVVQWCAPYSYVTSYTVMVDGRERQSFGESRRTGSISGVVGEAEVCVIAVNDVGGSDKSCRKYKPQGDRLPLTAWLIGGAGGLLLVLLLAAMLWCHRKQKKQEPGDV